MKKNKKEVYKELLNNLNRTKSISKSTRNILSEKGGRLVCQKLERFGYIETSYLRYKFKIVNITDKGKELLNKLNDFKYEFDEREVFK